MRRTVLVLLLALVAPGCALLKAEARELAAEGFGRAVHAFCRLDDDRRARYAQEASPHIAPHEITVSCVEPI